MVGFAAYCGDAAVGVLADEVGDDADEAVVGVGEPLDFQELLGAGVAVGAVVAGHGEAEFREAGVDKLADVDTFAVSVGDGAVVM